jgi:hypothetical protein
MGPYKAPVGRLGAGREGSRADQGGVWGGTGSLAMTRRLTNPLGQGRIRVRSDRLAEADGVRLMNNQLFDLELNSSFMWKGTVYRLISISDDKAKVVCLARTDVDGELYTVPNQEENFNPYCEVEAGQLTLNWRLS